MQYNRLIGQPDDRDYVDELIRILSSDEPQEEIDFDILAADILDIQGACRLATWLKSAPATPQIIILLRGLLKYTISEMCVQDSFDTLYMCYLTCMAALLRKIATRGMFE